MSDNPTQQFSPVPDEDPEESSKRLWIALGALAFVAVAVVAFLVLSARGDESEPAATDAATATTTTETPTPTPTETSTPTATTTKAPAPTGPQLTKFVATNKTVTCNTQSPSPSPQYVGFEWTSKGADKVYFGVNTADASTGALFDNLPNSGTQSDFPAGYSPYAYSCPSPKQSYTLTIVGDGKKVSKTVTVVNEGDTQ